jgi:dextranase
MNGSLNPVGGRSPVSELSWPDPEGLVRADTPARFVSFHPTRGFFPPEMPVTLSIEVSPAAVATTSVELRVVDLDSPVMTKRVDVKHEKQVIEVPLSAPAGTGFGLHATLVKKGTDETVDSAYSAVDFQNTWADAPRYAFLSQFGPEDEYEERADQLLQRHVTSVQFYDWMYRHYRLLPPSDDFTDVLGRRLSLTSVRSAISAVHNRGMAAIAYGSVYGAEAEYALEHPEELLYDESGKPITLADVFYLQDVRPGPWRDRILAEYRDAIRQLGFDGIHADQYGTETSGATAYDHKGHVVDLGPALAGIAGAAQEAVVEAGGDGIIFNCVTNWPIRETAEQEQLAIYIEVWPPYTTLGDLASLVNQAKVLAPQGQVILAAYMSCATDDPDAAEVATLLTSSTIQAAGGFHLLLGEGTGILVHAYYPNFVRPGLAFQERLIEHADFAVRYGRYLWDRSLVFDPAPSVQAGDLWCLRRTGTEFETLSLINADPGRAWDQVKSASPKRDVLVRLSPSGPVAAVYVASPGQPDAVRLPFQQQDGDLFFHVPELDLWSLVVMQYEK